MPIRIMQWAPQTIACLYLAAQCYAQENTAAQTTILSAVPTESYNSAVSSTTPDPSNYDSNPFEANFNSVGLGITIAGVVPFVLVVRTMVVWLLKWREWRQRKRRAPQVGRYGRVKRQDEEAVGFGKKAELSAKQARFEKEAEERRFEISGIDARVEMPVGESTQELWGHEVAQELRGDEYSHEVIGRLVYRQPGVLILT